MKKQVDENNKQIDFNAGNKEEYELEAIWDSVFYAKKSIGYLLGLYYLVLWKSYPRKKNT